MNRPTSSSVPRASLANSPIAARLFDVLVASPTHNRLTWSTDPADYAAFAARALGSARGPVLEVAAGASTATLPLHVASGRSVLMTDRSEAMLAVSRRRAETLWPDAERARLEWQQVDLWDLREGGYDTVLALGLLHLIDDVGALLEHCRGLCRPGGTVWATGLVAATRRGGASLGALHRAGEAVAPRTLSELTAQLPDDCLIGQRGCMAYVVLARP